MDRAADRHEIDIVYRHRPRPRLPGAGCPGCHALTQGVARPGHDAVVGRVAVARCGQTKVVEYR